MKTNTKLKVVRLFAVEDQELYRKMYSAIFPSDSPINLLDISANEDIRAINDKLLSLSPDVLLIGTKILSQSIIKDLEQIRADFPKLGIVLLPVLYSAEGIEQLRKLATKTESGMAIILKQSLDRVDQLFRIITAASEGEVIVDLALTRFMFADKQVSPFLKELTARELEILNLLSKGYTNAAIAEALYIDIRTVHHHINSIYSKIKAGSDLNYKHPRVNAARLYLETIGELLVTSAAK